MRPNRFTKFKPISELENYVDSKKYFCSDIEFAPEEDKGSFTGCPPYISIDETDDLEYNKTLYFKIPEIVAYYAKKHAGYTSRGRDQIEDQGRRQLIRDIKLLLKLD